LFSLFMPSGGASGIRWGDLAMPVPGSAHVAKPLIIKGIGMAQCCETAPVVRKFARLEAGLCDNPHTPFLVHVS
jgi:hypothetical protein